MLCQHQVPADWSAMGRTEVLAAGIVEQSQPQAESMHAVCLCVCVCSNKTAKAEQAACTLYVCVCVCVCVKDLEPNMEILVFLSWEKYLSKTCFPHTVPRSGSRRNKCYFLRVFFYVF